MNMFSKPQGKNTNAMLVNKIAGRIKIYNYSALMVSQNNPMRI